MLALMRPSIFSRFLRQGVLPKAVRHWALTAVQQKLIRIGAKAAHYYGKIVFASGQKACGKVQMSMQRVLCPKEVEGGLEGGLANLWRRKRITKKAHANRG